MRRTIHFKFILAYLMGVLMIFLMFNFFGSRLLEKKLVEERKNVLYSEANLIAESYMENYFSDLMTFSYLNTQLRTIDTFLDVRIWIVDRQHNLLLDTRASSVSEQSIAIPELTEDFLSRGFVEHVTIPGYMETESLGAILPVSLNYSIKGYILIFSSYDAVESSVNNYMNTVNLIGLFLFAALFVMLLLFDLALLLPMKKITKAAGEYSAGHYDYELTVDTNDEFEDLAKSVSFLAKRIHNLDEYQNKFISNISHDFRSPLTSIKGYAEAILDGTIPHEMQDKYLNIILFETERLTKLTSNLLEMNRFNGEGSLHRSRFDINHTIRQTAASFEGTCQKKRITLKLTFEEEETYVNADLGKIQQVLYNLLDNAIKFSHNNSTIRIKTEERNGKIFVSVKDTGIGIPQESITKIWDRFYKTDLSRGKDKKGTGLGLSITREIIHAHGENINVISTEGAGTEFIFSLKSEPQPGSLRP